MHLVIIPFGLLLVKGNITLTNAQIRDIIYLYLIFGVNILDNRYYEKIVSEMQAFFDENGFKAESDNFVSEQKAVSIKYDEDKQIYNLYIADSTDGKIGEFALISSYLFDDSQTEKDAVAVGIDFVDTLRSKLGIKAVRKNALGNIDLPTAKKGDAVTINTLTTKILAIYPALKDVYKQEINEKGKYLYLDFLTTYAVPEIRKTLETANKKTIKKLIDSLTELFIHGDNDTSTVIVAILVSAIGKNETRFKAATEHMESCSNLVASINNQISLLGKNKKFTAAVKYVD